MYLYFNIIQSYCYNIYLDFNISVWGHEEQIAQMYNK